MPRPRISVPTYRQHKPTGMALSDFRDPVTGTKRCVTLGPWNSELSRKEHARLCSELATGKSVAGATGLTVVELARAYLGHAETYYVKNGRRTDEVDAVRSALKALRLTHSHTAVGEFTPRALVAVQNHMIGLGWCRRTINKQLARVRRVFKWGVLEGLVDESIHTALTTVPGLKAGRSAAREKAKVTAVDDAVVERTLPHLSRPVRAMVRLQRLVGARPGEVVILRPMDVDRTGTVWVYTPSTHKTEHLDLPRHIMLGPKAQEVLLPFLDRLPTEYCFSPRDAVAELRERQRATRKERKGGSGGNRKVKAANPDRAPRERYDVDSYRQAVNKACRKAGVSMWSPNQLRHAAAADILANTDRDRARATLGHSGSSMTDNYTRSADGKLAAEVAARMG